MKILFLINEINYTCGITRHLLSIIKHIKNRNDIEVLILSGGGNAGELFRSIGIEPIIRP